MQRPPVHVVDGLVQIQQRGALLDAQQPRVRRRGVPEADLMAGLSAVDHAAAQQGVEAAIQLFLQQPAVFGRETVALQHHGHTVGGAQAQHLHHAVLR